jgi:hypothetical protein
MPPSSNRTRASVTPYGGPSQSSYTIQSKQNSSCLDLEETEYRPGTGLVSSRIVDTELDKFGRKHSSARDNIGPYLCHSLPAPQPVRSTALRSGSSILRPWIRLPRLFGEYSATTRDLSRLDTEFCPASRDLHGQPTRTAACSFNTKKPDCH